MNRPIIDHVPHNLFFNLGGSLGQFRIQLINDVGTHSEGLADLLPPPDRW
jgi:hypothetical protein